LATHPSALKRARQNKTRRLKNISQKTRMRGAIKEVMAAMNEMSPDQATEKYQKAASIIQKTASKGIIHKRNASRKISRLAHHVNRLKSTQTGSTT